MARGYSPRDPWSDHRVLGRRLRPFCLWHRFLLEAIESPLLIPGATLLPVDLRRAVAICRNRFREGRVRPLPSLLDAWRLAGRGFAREQAAFEEYIGDFHVRPIYAIKTDTGSKAKRGFPAGPPPEILSLVGDIIGWSSWPDWRVWELPIGEVHFYASCVENARLAPTGSQQDWLTDRERKFQADLKAKERRERGESPEQQPDK